MRPRSVIAVTFLDGAAVAAALFFGLQPHGTTASRPVTAAQAPAPSISIPQLLEEEARTRAAQLAPATADRARERHTREARREAARSGRSHNVRAREAKHAARERAPVRSAHAVRPAPETATRTGAKSGGNRHGRSRAEPERAQRVKQEADARRQLEREDVRQRRLSEHSERASRNGEQRTGAAQAVS
jgi:hypothetical protein